MKLPINYTIMVEYKGTIDLYPSDFLDCEDENEVVDRIAELCANAEDVNTNDWYLNEDSMDGLEDFLDLWSDLKNTSDSND